MGNEKYPKIALNGYVKWTTEQRKTKETMVGRSEGRL